MFIAPWTSAQRRFCTSHFFSGVISSTRFVEKTLKLSVSLKLCLSYFPLTIEGSDQVSIIPCPFVQVRIRSAICSPLYSNMGLWLSPSTTKTTEIAFCLTVSGLSHKWWIRTHYQILWPRGGLIPSLYTKWSFRFSLWLWLTLEHSLSSKGNLWPLNSYYLITNFYDQDC